MNLQNLNNIKPTRITYGRPSSTLTDKEWQTEFSLMKLHVTPYKNITRMGGKYSRESGREVKNYDGITNWQSYCSFINETLKYIRKGNRDCCFFAYQIEDLLKFHYDDLRTKYCDGYWEVWLDNA